MFENIAMTTFVPIFYYLRGQLWGTCHIWPHFGLRLYNPLFLR